VGHAIAEYDTMQNYATQQDLIDAIGEDELIRLSDTRANPGVIGADLVARALDRASVDIDARLSARYPKPFAAIPRVLVGICCDMAVYRLCGTEGRVMTDEIRDQYREALKLLALIANGEVKLGADMTDTQVFWPSGVQTAPARSSFDRDLEDFR